MWGIVVVINLTGKMLQVIFYRHVEAYRLWHPFILKH